MKRIISRLLILSALFAGCSSESPLDGKMESNDTFAIEVMDSGFSDADGKHTRAVEQGYVTKFSDGDKIGVYAVKAGEVTARNICMEMRDGKWEGPLYYEGLNMKYFAYYPYDADLDEVDASADQATDFFAKYIESFEPQSEDSYTAGDLMVGSGLISAVVDNQRTVVLKLSHQMSLLEIELPDVTYSLSTDAGYTWTVDAKEVEFEGFEENKVYKIDGAYRYLFNPKKRQLAGTYSVSYKVNAGRSKYTFTTKNLTTLNGLSPGYYQKYVIDGGNSKKEHSLQIGDFFMKDGSLVGKDEKLTTAQQAACIGIVYWVGDPTKPLRDRTEPNLQGDATLATDHPGCTHGLVVSLGEESCAWQASQTFVQEWLESNPSDKFLPVRSGYGASDPLNNIQGYNNTKAIEAFNASSDNSGNQVYVVQKVVEYRKRVPAPVASSGWYVPSEKELTLLCGEDVDNIFYNNFGGTDNRDLINRKLALIGGATPLSSSSNYWSSTESSYSSAFNVNFYDGNVVSSNKYDNSFRVRFSFAF